jgi:hypothetical protein
MNMAAGSPRPAPKAAPSPMPDAPKTTTPTAIPTPLPMPIITGPSRSSSDPSHCSPYTRGSDCILRQQKGSGVGEEGPIARRSTAGQRPGAAFRITMVHRSPSRASCDCLPFAARQLAQTFEATLALMSAPNGLRNDNDWTRCTSSTPLTDGTHEQLLKHRVATLPDNEQRCMIGFSEQDLCSVSSYDFVRRKALAYFRQHVGDDLN